MAGLGHNGAPGALHLAQLRQAAAAVRAQLQQLDASAAVEVRNALQEWRRFDCGRFSAPSRLAKCPRDRAILAGETARLQAAAAAKRAGQVAHLTRKLARIEAALQLREGGH